VHALEYLWKAAYCLYEPGSSQAEDWVHKHAVALLEGKLSGVAGGMRPLMATQIPPPVATSNSPTPLRRDDRLNPVFCHR